MAAHENFSSNYSRYYDLLYRDKNYKAEADYVAQLITTYKPTAKTILELGCGTGNHAQFLSQHNYSITGVDRSVEMVKLAQAKQIPNFEAKVSSIENVELSNKADVAISLFHVISYLNSNEQLLHCFRNLHKQLNPDGIFIFDIWFTPAVYFQKPETRIKRLDDDKLKVTRIAESTMNHNAQVVTVNFEIIIQDKQNGQVEFHRESHPMRHFGLAEIDLLAGQTGFRVLKSEEFLSGNAPGTDTWGVCFILQKNN